MEIQKESTTPRFTEVMKTLKPQRGELSESHVREPEDSCPGHLLPDEKEKPQTQENAYRHTRSQFARNFVSLTEP